MSPSNRRRFLQQAAVGASAVALTPGLMAANRHRTVPHREQRVPGVHAYALSESVAAGGTLEFCVSADRPYDFAIIQLGEDPDSTNKDKILHQFARQPHRVQPIHPGSCVTLERGMDRAPEEFTVECWLRPFAFGRWQDVVCQMNYPVNCDFALAISPEGHVAFYLGDGGKFDNRWPLNAGAAGQLSKLRWHHIVLTRAGARTAIWLDGKQVASGTAYAESGGQSWNAPLRLGAGGTEGRTDDLFDGDIAMPVLYSRALTATEIARRFAQRGLEPATGDGVLGCWPLTEERGDRIRDVSGNRRHGRIVNHATWMIGGPSFDPEVARFGDYDPATDPKRGHGLRFASDDLYDCGWDVTHRWRVPGDTKPGIHVGRLRFMEGDELHVQYVTF
ncbi:MAG TPA: hypothetical protein DCY13_12490, partial [Verrucomicrobiales bacterium]|nr:hypothetical protein [Verrucomicrobiales bacterium]